MRGREGGGQGPLDYYVILFVKSEFFDSQNSRTRYYEENQNDFSLILQFSSRDCYFLWVLLNSIEFSSAFFPASYCCSLLFPGWNIHSTARLDATTNGIRKCKEKLNFLFNLDDNARYQIVSESIWMQLSQTSETKDDSETTPFFGMERIQIMSDHSFARSKSSLRSTTWGSRCHTTSTIRCNISRPTLAATGTRSGISLSWCNQCLSASQCRWDLIPMPMVAWCHRAIIRPCQMRREWINNGVGHNPLC